MKHKSIMFHLLGNTCNILIHHMQYRMNFRLSSIAVYVKIEFTQLNLLITLNMNNPVEF